QTSRANLTASGRTLRSASVDWLPPSRRGATRSRLPPNPVNWKLVCTPFHARPPGCTPSHGWHRRVIENRLAEWRRPLRQSTTQARTVLQRVLRGRLTFTPRADGQG